MTDGFIFILCEILFGVYCYLGFKFIRERKWNR